MKTRMYKCALLLILAAFSLTSHARELGHYVPGVANIRDLAVPAAPGFYFEQYNVHYSTNTYKDRNGDSVNSHPIGPATIQFETDIDVYAITPVLMWVTDKKILDGDYAFYAAPTIANNGVNASLSTFNRTGSFGTDNTGLGDLFIQPLWLGWRDTKYDLSLGLGLYVPIGEHEEDADDNIGLGFWTGQIQAAGYYYLDDQQSSALMLAAAYETHTEKSGTDITPGDHFTLEYGYSQYLSQRLEVGVSGYSQWQVKDDTGTTLLDNAVDTEVRGVGAQISYWATPRFSVSLKYMKEYDAKARTEGDWMMFNLTYLPGPLF
jgi:hypothetical protein